MAECVAAFSFTNQPMGQCAAAPSSLSTFGVCPRSRTGNALSRGPHSLYITLCGLCRKSRFVACDACRIRFFCTECAVAEPKNVLAMRRVVAGISGPPPLSPPSSPPASRPSPPVSPKEAFTAAQEALLAAQTSFAQSQQRQDASSQELEDANVEVAHQEARLQRAFSAQRAAAHRESG